MEIYRASDWNAMQAAAEDQAEHTVDRRNDWCLMWTAPAGQRVTVAGAWTVRKAGAK